MRSSDVSYGTILRLSHDGLVQYAHKAGGAAGANWSDWKSIITSDNIGSQSVNYATSAGNADTLDGYHFSNLEDRYVNVTGDTMTGALTVKQYIFGYNYNHAGGNAPAFIFDKPGSNYTGIGAHSTSDTIWFGAATISSGEAVWVDSYKQKWVFNGTVTADRFYGPLTGNVTGNADTATNADKLDNYHANGLLTAASLGTSGNSTTISVTVGGTTKTGSVTVPYATNADTVDNLHASNFARFFLSPMTSGAPADSAKSWFTGTMPSASGAIIYNVPGSEKTIIAGKSSGAYGHMLQLNYDDNYLRLLRYQAGSWKTTDWEKISAGYADSAGNADTVDGYHASSFALSSHTHDDRYVKRGGDDVTGHYTFRGRVFGYNYNNQGNNAAAFMWDKPGSYYTGMGPNGVSNQIHFGPCNADGTWVSGFSQQWEFQGNIYASGFCKNGSSNSYVLLGGGGHKALSDFSTIYGGPNSLVIIGVFDLYKTNDSTQTWSISTICGPCSFSLQQSNSNTDISYKSRTSSPQAWTISSSVLRVYVNGPSSKTPYAVSCDARVMTRWINNQPVVTNCQHDNWKGSSVECLCTNLSNGSSLYYSSSSPGRYIYITGSRPWGYDDSDSGLGMDMMRNTGNLSYQRIRFTVFGYIS